ncbi:hypothetical protein [Plantactinospora sp. B5E13]|uniref:hypothetical protein n=1 Tax=unclassified Plantactinospora TaxID=2631981 RepID=UPI00325CA5B8
MTGFYVDPTGLNGLYNLLWRASGDARDALDYTRRNCDLNLVEVGLLMNMVGPHRQAYQQVTNGLQEFVNLTQGAATQVNLAQRMYATSDAAATARLDQTYPGAKDPGGLGGALAERRPDLWPSAPRSLFSDVAEPGQQLGAPNYASGIEEFQINLLSDLVSPSAWARQVSTWLFGVDPFEGWGKLVAGDWESYTYCGAAWRAVGDAMLDVSRNLTTGAADVSEVWRGNAAEAEQEFQLVLGGAAMTAHGVLDRYADLYAQVSEAAKNLFAALTNLLGKLLDALIMVCVAGAVGTATIKTGIGAVAGYGAAAYYAWQAYDLYKEISTVYGNAEVTFKSLGALISAVDARLGLGSLPQVKPYHHPALD